ncbi:MAG: Glutamate racemase, partial [uncultured Solirubrobacterales bacterium]
DRALATRAPDRRLRLRGRGTHRTARVPRVPAPRGLPLPRRHGPLSVRRALGAGAARLRPRARRHPARARIEAPDRRLQLGHRGGSAGAARAPRRPGRGGRRGRAGVAARRSGHPQRASRAPGHAGDRRERRLRPGTRRGRPRRHARVRPRAGSRSADPGRPRGRRARGRAGRAAVRAAARRGGRHRDPRVHPLSARAADAPARAGATRRDRLLGRGHRRGGRALAGRRWPRPARGPARRLSLPVLGRSGGLPGARHALPPASARRGAPRRGRTGGRWDRTSGGRV